MQIWVADFHFELIGNPKDKVKKYLTVNNVVTVRVPQDHLYKKTDILKRPLRSVSDLTTLAKDVQGKYKVKVGYKKFLSNTNYIEDYGS